VTAQLVDGTAVARQVREDVAKGVAELAAARGTPPGLATVLIGDDPASEVYVRNKRRACTAAGMQDFHRHLPADITQEEVVALVDELAADPDVSGILLQLPLPKGLDRFALVDRIPPAKDVDGLTTLSRGLLARDLPGLRPCTPAGVIKLIDAARIPLEGAAAVVVGRSELVGHPAAELLLSRRATVTIAHSHTRDLAKVTRQADVLVVAAGVPGLITTAHVKPGTAVIDVGIHRTDSGLTGDVAYNEVAEVAGWITPVPGGVGPMTIAMLLANTLTAATMQAAGDDRA
jgi:methylenetetrahydrofolate dehydrogenase (NADP+)/methenyltetrahydrofolate cyclohydrolase